MPVQLEAYHAAALHMRITHQLYLLEKEESRWRTETKLGVGSARIAPADATHANSAAVLPPPREPSATAGALSNQCCTSRYP